MSWQSQGTIAASQVKKALSRWEGEGAIRRTEHTATILDLDLLRQIAERLQPGETPDASES